MATKFAKESKLVSQARKLTAAMPAGTAVRFWKGAKDGPGAVGNIVTDFEVMNGHTVVGWIRDVDGNRIHSVAASHIVKV